MLGALVMLPKPETQLGRAFSDSQAQGAEEGMGYVCILVIVHLANHGPPFFFYSQSTSNSVVISRPMKEFSLGFETLPRVASN